MRLLRFALGMLAAVGAGCDGCDTPPPPPPSTAASATVVGSGAAFPQGRPRLVPPRSAVGVNVVQSGRWSVADGVGEPVLDVTLEREEARLRWPQGQIVGELRGGSRRYVEAPEAKSFIIKVKRRGPIAVLRGPDGRVAWRVVLGPHDIRYWRGSDTDEPAYVLVGGALRRGRELVGRVVTRGGVTIVVDAQGTVRFSVAEGPASEAWAALMFDGVDDAQRFVLAAEVLVRGR